MGINKNYFLMEFCFEIIMQSNNAIYLILLRDNLYEISMKDFHQF